MTAGLGIKMATSNSKWRVCDVIVTSRYVITDKSEAQSVKLMTCYKRAKFHRRSFITFRDLWGRGGGVPPPQAQKLKKSPGRIGLMNFSSEIKTTGRNEI